MRVRAEWRLRDAPFDLSQVLGNQFQVRQSGRGDGLVMLARDLQQPPDVLHVLGCQREFDAQPVVPRLLRFYGLLGVLRDRSRPPSAQECHGHRDGGHGGDREQNLRRLHTVLICTSSAILAAAPSGAALLPEKSRR